MAIWNIVEIFRDKHLLKRIQEELAEINFQGVQSNDDVKKLLSLPLLQSVYAELLRLRIEVQTVFNSEKEDIVVNQWRFPKKSLLLVPAGAAHRDTDFWNTQNGQHPLDEFWAERFLVYPNDPQSGPQKSAISPAPNDRPGSGNPGPMNGSNKPRYAVSGLTNSFIPYGVGERTCPGRGFARREIVTTCALAVTHFDIEILSTEKTFATNSAFYGIGTQRPLKPIPFRIRRKRPVHST